MSGLGCLTRVTYLKSMSQENTVGSPVKISVEIIICKMPDANQSLFLRLIDHQQDPLHCRGRGGKLSQKSHLSVLHQTG